MGRCYDAHRPVKSAADLRAAAFLKVVTWARVALVPVILALILAGPDNEAAFTAAANPIELRFDRRGLVLPVLAATPEEQRAHEAMLAVMAKKGQPLWRELEQEAAARTAPAAAA